MKENRKNFYMLENKKLNTRGYDWWWHSFTGYHKETGEEKQFFIEYFVINPNLGGEYPILGQLKDNKEKDIKPSYVMIKAGAWGKNKKQIHDFYGIESLKYKKEKLELKIEENILTESKIKGSVSKTKQEIKNHPEFMSDAGSMKWDLKIDKKLQFDVGFGSSSFFRKINAFDMYWHAQGMKSEFEGKVELDGEIYDIIPSKSYGYQDKNWGCDYTSPWIWLNCNNIKYKDSEESLDSTSLDIGGGCPVVMGKELNGKILTKFFYQGKSYEYNFSKFWTGSKQKYKFYEHEDNVQWVVTSTNRKSKLEVDFTCNKEDMLLVNYENPDGEKKHNYLLNGGTAKGTIKLYEKQAGKFKLTAEFEGENGGCEYGEYDRDGSIKIKNN
ncbi:MAG: tocopherol cyclase family protein [Clostridiaceae bacterium]